MQTSVTFKNIDPSDHLSNYVSSKLDRFDKYLDNPATANVVLSVQKFRHITEINIFGDRLNIIGKEETDNMYSSIDRALDKIGIQIKKNREKIRRRKGNRQDKAGDLSESDGLSLGDDQKPEVRVHPIEYKPMDVEEAIMQIDLVKDNFLVFTNARSDQVNVLYRKKDGNFGLIQPSN